MARLHAATLTPTKPELLAEWVPDQPWCPDPDAEIEVIGAFRFDDPEGEVGIETHLLLVADTIVQVPLTYRNEQLDGADDALVGNIEHSVLGTRWVYDGVRDDRYLMMAAAVAMSGQGQAVGLFQIGDRWYVNPSPIRLTGGGATDASAPVDGFTLVSDDADGAVLRSDGRELLVHRHPPSADQPPIGLRAIWDGATEPVVLVEIRPLPEPEGA